MDEKIEARKKARKKTVEVQANLVLLFIIYNPYEIQVLRCRVFEPDHLP